MRCDTKTWTARLPLGLRPPPPSPGRRRKPGPSLRVISVRDSVPASVSLAFSVCSRLPSVAAVATRLKCLILRFDHLGRRAVFFFFCILSGSSSMSGYIHVQDEALK